MMRWGPDLEHPEIAVLHLETDLDDLGVLLARLSSLRQEIGVPLQALRADRIVSDVHLVMAAAHAKRALAAGRQRADDPAVEFLLFAAVDRQIHRAVTALGLPRERVERLVLVALTPVDRGSFEARAMKCLSARSALPTDPETARAWWAGRLGLAAGADLGTVEAGLLARMALLALDKP